MFGRHVGGPARAQPSEPSPCTTTNSTRALHCLSGSQCSAILQLDPPPLSLPLIVSCCTPCIVSLLLSPCFPPPICAATHLRAPEKHQPPFRPPRGPMFHHCNIPHGNPHASHQGCRVHNQPTHQRANQLPRQTCRCALSACAACTAASASSTAGASGHACLAASSAWCAACQAAAAHSHSSAPTPAAHGSRRRRGSSSS